MAGGFYSKQSLFSCCQDGNCAIVWDDERLGSTQMPHGEEAAEVLTGTSTNVSIAQSSEGQGVCIHVVQSASISDTILLVKVFMVLDVAR